MKKKYSRILSVLLAITMVLTSLSVVFAVDGAAEPQSDADVVTDELAVDVSEEAAPAEEPAEEVSGEAADDAEETAEEAVEVRLLAASPAVTVTVKYVFDNGAAAADEAVVEVAEDGSYSIASPAIAGYKPDQDVVSGTTDVSLEVTVTYSPAAAAAVSNLKLHPSYNSIILTWNRVEDAKEYVVKRSLDNKTFTDYATVANPASGTVEWKDEKANGITGDFRKARTYYYRVYSVSQTDIRAEQAAAASGTCVRPMYETVTFKKAVKLTSHDGKSKKVTFKKGQTIVAQGFGGGKYRFWYKGNYFYAAYVRVKNCKADYLGNSIAKSKSYSGIWGKQNYASSDSTGMVNNFSGIKCYDKTSAEDFVNSSGKTSSTKYLIWVSTYQQHLYVFQGKKGSWKLIKDWECATGAAKSPTPTGFEKKLQKKTFKSRHGIKWWKTFQTLNSIHGKKASWVMGGPASNGCVRNFDKNAEWVYKNCATGTGLIVY